MAIVGMMRDGEWWESDDMSVADASRLIDEIDGESSTENSTGKSSTGTKRENSKDRSEEVVKEAAKLVKKTVERSQKTNDKKARAMEIITKLDSDGVDQGKVIKAVMEDLGITYANARYYYVSCFKKNGNR